MQDNFTYDIICRGFTDEDPVIQSIRYNGPSFYFPLQNGFCTNDVPVSLFQNNFLIAQNNLRQIDSLKDLVTNCELSYARAFHGIHHIALQYEKRNAEFFYIGAGEDISLKEKILKRRIEFTIQIKSRTSY